MYGNSKSLPQALAVNPDQVCAGFGCHARKVVDQHLLDRRIQTLAADQPLEILDLGVDAWRRWRWRWRWRWRFGPGWNCGCRRRAHTEQLGRARAAGKTAAQFWYFRSTVQCARHCFTVLRVADHPSVAALRRAVQIDEFSAVRTRTVANICDHPSAAGAGARYRRTA